MTPRPTCLLQLGALCSLPALLAFAFALPDAPAPAGGNARLLLGIGSALGLGLLLAWLSVRGWQAWRGGEGAAAWWRWAGTALLVLPLLLFNLLGLSALGDSTLAVSVTYASAGAMYGLWVLWLLFSLGLLWLGRRLDA